ncbi:ubiquinol-cytochrome C chaperone family protein [Bradyrhizobium guangzhouense]|uniref:ubiquinol-cytochrome C chaperone family protein n=1 Tax=Bradyrhizobium guangzhouense TaxID=1325095 RepID=UPI001009EF5C|nr:ubiquinol-cytochrome C chaperone family protein [Bradyrhizobium guangzhouense]RXH14305.1 ubiquinol-cytochrome C chaperone [Bradyrhizobium guangzhouense]
MLWPFNHFRKPRLALAGTIEAIYGMIVTQAREPKFYRDLGVPDTVNGRFDLLLLHLWLLLRRLRTVAQGGAELSQGLFDRFCEDMDDNLREMGVGDQTVPKRMRAFGEAFYGRVQAYDQAIAAGIEALAQAICKNILNGAGLDQARRLAAYAIAADADLGQAGDAALLQGSFRFPAPLREDETS